MKVSLARALKERSRLAGKLKRDMSILNQENSAIRGSERAFDLHAVYAECNMLFRQLVELKQIIAAANAPIAGKLVEMGETKSMIAQLRNVDTTVGYKARNSYGAGEMDYMEVVFGAAELTAAADELQARVETLQDEIDEFNALTKVDIPDM